MEQRVQRVSTGLVLLALAGLPVAGLAQSQTVPIPHFTNKQLDAISKAQNAAHPERWGPPPPQSSVPQPVITPLKGLWVCKSVNQDKPIYAAPSKSAQKLAITMAWEAVTGSYVNGFAKVLIHRGLVGYVRSAYVHPFLDQYNPKATCQVSGTWPNGRPGFDIR